MIALWCFAAALFSYFHWFTHFSDTSVADILEPVWTELNHMWTIISSMAERMMWPEILVPFPWPLAGPVSIPAFSKFLKLQNVFYLNFWWMLFLKRIQIELKLMPPPFQVMFCCLAIFIYTFSWFCFLQPSFFSNAVLQSWISTNFQKNVKEYASPCGMDCRLHRVYIFGFFLGRHYAVYFPCQFCVAENECTQSPGLWSQPSCSDSLIHTKINFLSRLWSYTSANSLTIFL